MINLLPNYASEQYIYLTPNDVIERPTGKNYRLVFVGAMGQASFDIIPRIIDENSRYTKLGLWTNEDDSENGKALVVETGEYNYSLKMDDEVLEIGSMIIGRSTPQDYYQTPKNNIIYYEG